MAIKKSEIYRAIWASCDELRGGMDASQYKDYVLVLLFVKYVSDKYACKMGAIEVPKGSSFADMVALKGTSTIGDDINKKIVAPLAAANNLSGMPDFNDPDKLGKGKEMVDRLTNLISIFESPSLDFSKNRADDDDLLGDAYEYLMRNFATESGKSKGQFYTPAEVSRVIAQIIGISPKNTTNQTRVYDPTCGSGSLLLKVAAESMKNVSLYGQEKDMTTAGLARMNMILHNQPTAEIAQGNTLTDPFFMDNGKLRLFDYVVANPPFSDKRWSTGLDTEKDPHERFKHYGIPPAKQGDYAYLLHIVASLNSTGKGACILPHGVLFRGNAEAEIRKNLINKGYIKGIVGLPANLFYGTGIPACIVVIDKAASRHATSCHERKTDDIFIIDASGGYIKDGNKNRLRARDIHKIVDVWNTRTEIEGYSRAVTLDEVEKNDFNLNIPRYINSRKPETVQDIERHLRGGLPTTDIDAFQDYWKVCPSLRASLFVPEKNAEKSMRLAVPKEELQRTIHTHPEFAAMVEGLNGLFNDWSKKISIELKALAPGFRPKTLIKKLADDILAHYADAPLVDNYAIYQHLMDYWEEVMQDDCYQISAEGWKVEFLNVSEREGRIFWDFELVPKQLMIERFYSDRKNGIDEKSARLEVLQAELEELKDEHGGEDGIFSEFEKVNKAKVKARLKEISSDKNAEDEISVLKKYLSLDDEISKTKKKIVELQIDLNDDIFKEYSNLTVDVLKDIVVDEKWTSSLYDVFFSELRAIGQNLTRGLADLVERYGTPLGDILSLVREGEAAVAAHLRKMGFASK